MKFFLFFDIYREHFSPASKLACLVLLLLINYETHSQSFFYYHKPPQVQITISTGITKYFGELSIAKKLGDVNPYFGMGVEIPVKTRWWIRPEIVYYRLSAADSDLPSGDSRRERNLSFRSNNLELSATMIYSLQSIDLRRKLAKLGPYFLVGLGTTYSNPKAELEGQWHELQPLQTEGVNYSKFQIIVPLGVGLSYQVIDQWKIGLEISYRLSFSDHLDDVSTLYRDPASFSMQLAMDLADRRPEIGLDKAPTGSPRGNSETNDGYLFFGLRGYYELSKKGPLRRKW